MNKKSHGKVLLHWPLKRNGKLKKRDEDPDSTFTLFIHFPFFSIIPILSICPPLSFPLQPPYTDFTSTNVTRCVCICVCGCTLCALTHARDCSEGWVMLMSGSCVVISEPQAGRQEAAKHLVIWCGLRYRSPGVKLCLCVSVSLCEWETRRATSETTWSGHLCIESNGSFGCHSQGWCWDKKR